MPLSASAADEGTKYSVTTRTDKTPNLTNQPLTVYFDSKFSWNGQYNQVISGLAAHMYIYDEYCYYTDN